MTSGMTMVGDTRSRLSHRSPRTVPDSAEAAGGTGRAARILGAGAHPCNTPRAQGLTCQRIRNKPPCRNRRTATPIRMTP